MCLWNYISGNRDYQTKILIWRNKKTKAIYFMGTGTPSWSLLLSALICTCVCTRTDSRPDGRMEAFIISPSLFQTRGDKKKENHLRNCYGNKMPSSIIHVSFFFLSLFFLSVYPTPFILKIRFPCNKCPFPWNSLNTCNR